MCDGIPWDELFGEDVEAATDNVANIMNGYCDHIEKSSEESVHARFVEMKLVEKHAVGLAGIAMALSREGDLYEKDALDQRDINELYNSATYVFDIYNDRYQFRLCKLVYGAMYPVKVIIDEGVEEEIRDGISSQFEYDEHSEAYIIENDMDLKRCFASMITSRKAKNILRQLRKR
jgi:hypothetical protein